jgi:hypothetical protein
MTVLTGLPATVRASLNYAADRSDGGIWSNNAPHWITQKLHAHPVDIHDARGLASAPRLDEQGFELHRIALADARWTDPAWVRANYAPRAMGLVQALTGAPKVVDFTRAALIRDTGDASQAPAAQFVHLDQTRDSAAPFVAEAADEAERRRYPRVRIFNVWRALTPPPQNVPLALCDQRTVDPNDWVVGRTIEPKFLEGVPYLTSVFNPQNQWWWVSDLEPDEVIVFKGYDSDPEAPMGCLHGAFTHPGVGPGAVPRASLELRIFAFSEA